MARRRFCSPECAGLSRKGVKKTEWVEIRCQNCGKPFKVTPAWVRNGRRKYCSRRCHALANVAGKRLGKPHTEASRKKMSVARKGKQLREKSSQWKGGAYYRGGYKYVMIALLPESARGFAEKMVKGNYILEHRAIAAVKIGRFLEKGEVVHHLNGKKADNRPENLIVVSRASHSISHRALELKLCSLEAENARLIRENEELRSRLN